MRGVAAVSKVCAVLAAIILLLGGPRPARAQGLIDLVPSKEFTDSHGVDLAGSIYRHHERLLQIGGGPHPLSLNLHFTSPGLVTDIASTLYLALDSHSYFGNTVIGTADLTVVLPHQSGKFGQYGTAPNITVIPQDPSYVTAAYNSAFTHLSYVGGDGTEATLSNLHRAYADFIGNSHWGTAEQIKFPDGETWSYRYNDVQYSSPGTGSKKVSRIRSIVSSRGYGIQFDYAADPSGTVTSSTVMLDFMTMTRATAYNKASVHCSEALLASCASVTALSSAVTFAIDRLNRRITITKPNDEQVEFRFDTSYLDHLTGVIRPDGATRTMTYRTENVQDGPTYSFLSSLTEVGRTWEYAYDPIYNGSFTTVADPGNENTVYAFYNGAPERITDPLNRHTDFGYDGFTRFLRRRSYEGNEVTAAYDVRGNLNRVREIPKPGSSPPLESTAVFPPGCTAADRRSCNRPTSVTDRNLKTSDYSYSPDHGGVLTETGPAVPIRQADGSVANVRPHKWYEYAQRHAWTSNGAGGYVQGAPVWLPVRERSCRLTAAAGSSCIGGASDEIVTDYDYGPDSGPNNLLLRGVAVTADGGSGLVTRRTCYGYDDAGNRISETSPNAHLASCP